MSLRRPADRPAQIQLVLVMVGLPARGKTHIARRASRYLTWLGYKTRVFNVGNYRRERLGSQKDHSFFDPENDDARAARREASNRFGWKAYTWAASASVSVILATANYRQKRSK